MFYFVVFMCVVASAFGAPANTDVVPLEKQQPTVIPIVSQSDELEPNGTYHFSYETGNGIKRDEISYDKVVPKAEGRSSDSNEGGEDSDGDSDGIHVQIGSYSYTAPDGTLISVRYIADENGFQPIGDHIPRVPSASGSSPGEKSGRALQVADNAESASAPKAVEKPQAKASAPAPSSNAAPDEAAESNKVASTTESASSESPSTEAASTEGVSTEGASTEGVSTEGTSTQGASTEGASTEASSTEASSTEAASSTDSAATTEAPTTPLPDASTPTADASSPAAEQSTTTSEPSTTEAASPTTAAA